MRPELKHRRTAVKRTPRVPILRVFLNANSHLPGGLGASTVPLPQKRAGSTNDLSDRARKSLLRYSRCVRRGRWIAGALVAACWLSAGSTPFVDAVRGRGRTGRLGPGLRDGARAARGGTGAATGGRGGKRAGRPLWRAARRSARCALFHPPTHRHPGRPAVRLDALAGRCLGLGGGLPGGARLAGRLAARDLDPRHGAAGEPRRAFDPWSRAVAADAALPGKGAVVDLGWRRCWRRD